MNNSGKAIPIFVPLLAAYPVIFLAAGNPGQVTLGTAAAVTAASVLAAMAAYALLRLVSSSRLTAGYAVTLLIVMFFTYGQVSSWIDSLVISLHLGDEATPNVLDLVPGARLWVACVWGGVALAGAWIVARSKSPERPGFAKGLNFAAVALLFMAFSSPALGMFKSGQNGPVTTGSTASGDKATGPASRPDVYFIVLDGYARQDVLEHYYGFDNQPFLDKLRARGFGISEQSSSNYNWTFLSLSSTLNLGYPHEFLAGPLGPKNVDRTLAYDSIRNSLTARFLRERGYKLVHLRSTWGATSVNPYADREVRCEHGAYSSEFVRAVAEASWLGAFHTRASMDLARCHLANFEALSGMGADPGPKFVLAHFLLPHHPYLFDRDGNVLRNAVISNQFEFQKQLWEDRASYVSQLEFINHKIIDAIDRILAQSSRPPIIVLESDHGPGLIKGLDGNEHLAVRFANLGAYYLPGAPEHLIPATGTAVNQFRRILGYYFDADLPPLPDRHFVSPYAWPFAVQEVPHQILSSQWSTMREPGHAEDSKQLVAVHSKENTDARAVR